MCHTHIRKQSYEHFNYYKIVAAEPKKTQKITRIEQMEKQQNQKNSKCKFHLHWQYQIRALHWIENHTWDLNLCRISSSRAVKLLVGVTLTFRHITVESVACLRLLLAPLSALSPASATSSMRGLRRTDAERESAICFLSTGVSVCALSVSAFSPCASVVISFDLAALSWLRVSIRDCCLSNSVELDVWHCWWWYTTFCLLLQSYVSPAASTSSDDEMLSSVTSCVSLYSKTNRPVNACSVP